MSPELFVLATGQDDNIGDVVLRRECFDRLRTVGRLHLFLGDSSQDFVDGLCLDDRDTTYATMRQWHSAAWRALGRGEVWFVDKPGELQLDERTVNRQLKLAPLVVAVRLRGGQVLRLGMAMRETRARYLRQLRPLLRLSTRVCWRDTATGPAFGFGTIGPDWAFARDAAPEAIPSAARVDVAVSYRGDRPLPSSALLDELAALTRGGTRRLVVLAQVRRDTARAAELAERLGAVLVPWPDERTLAEHEAVVRAVYRHSALVVSDRLHALIVGMTEGAVPLCLSDHGEAKIERHLDAVGFGGATVRLDGSTPHRALLEGQVARRAELSDALTRARDELAALVSSLRDLAARGRGADVR